MWRSSRNLCQYFRCHGIYEDGKGYKYVVCGDAFGTDSAGTDNDPPDTVQVVVVEMMLEMKHVKVTFVDSDQATCADYAMNPDWCADAADFTNANGHDANDSCCVCNSNIARK